MQQARGSVNAGCIWSNQSVFRGGLQTTTTDNRSGWTNREHIKLCQSSTLQQSAAILKLDQFQPAGWCCQPAWVFM